MNEKDKRLTDERISFHNKGYYNKKRYLWIVIGVISVTVLTLLGVYLLKSGATSNTSDLSVNASKKDKKTEKEWEIPPYDHLPVTAAEADAAPDWLGLTMSPAAISNSDRPLVKTPNKKLIGVPQIVTDMHIYKVDLPADSLAEKLVWAPDGLSFFLLNKNGIIYQISVPQLQIIREIDAQHDVSDISMTKSGLLIVMNIFQELRVLDLNSLIYTTVIQCPCTHYVAASPNNDMAVVFQKKPVNTFSVVDISNKSIVGTIRGDQLGPGTSNTEKNNWNNYATDFTLPQMTNDGKYFFCIASYAILRFRIEEPQFIYEEQSKRLNSNNAFFLSPDNNYIALNCNNDWLKNENRYSKNGWYVFRVNNLSRPDSNLDTPVTNFLSFDLSSERFFIYNDSNLSMCSTDGQILKTYPMDRHDYQIRKLWLHPDGHKMLMLKSESVYWLVF